MDDSKEKLGSVLEDLVKLLNSDGQSNWSNWMSGAKKRIDRGDIGGVDRVLEAYGGMGSFNDLILGQQVINGQLQWKKGHNEMNEKLESLREEAYGLCMELRS